jgi:hypothetical protein
MKKSKFSEVQIVKILEEYDAGVRLHRHPSYFDEYKSAMVEIYPERVVSDDQLRLDYYKMAFKIEVRKNPIYSFLTYEQIDEVANMK